MKTECDCGCGAVTFKLVAVKRRWIPDWLFGLFCPNAATQQPWRWLLTTEPDPFTKRRINGKQSDEPVIEENLK